MKPHDHCKAIPTIYGGVQMRSRMETQCALLFDRLGWKWEYETKSYMLRNGVAYIPDFCIPSMRLVAECRGYESDKGEAQIAGFAAEMAQHGIYEYLVIGPAKCHIYSDSRTSRKAEITYCTICECWTFTIPDKNAGVCQECGEFTFTDLPLTVSAGKVLLGGLSSEHWQEVFFSHPCQMLRFLLRVVQQFYRTTGSFDIANEVGRIAYTWDGKNPESFDLDFRNCSLNEEDAAFVVQTQKRLQRFRRSLPQSKDGPQ